MAGTRRPIIGCTTYHKVAAQANPIDIYGLMPSYIEAVKAAGGIPVLMALTAAKGWDYTGCEILPVILIYETDLRCVDTRSDRVRESELTDTRAGWNGKFSSLGDTKGAS